MTIFENQTLQMPDRLFEVSWEVCNKVGGIHTVIATKALSAVTLFGDRYVTIGPDIHREEEPGEFEEDPSLMSDWRQIVYDDGIRIRIGRWRIEGAPIAVLVDFSSFFSRKDEILKFFWEAYHVDSISGQWDYIEPVLFGYAVGRVIESYCKIHCSPEEKSVVHMHEWLTASAGLYLRRFSPYIATLFSTHATVVGRTLAGNGLPLYETLNEVNADEIAHRFNVVAKHSIEKIAARQHDCFCTVSDITSQECRYLLDAVPDQITPNGFERGLVWDADELRLKRRAARQAIIRVAESCLECRFGHEPLIAGIGGRYEFRNKGIDVFIEALSRLSHTLEGEREILACIAVPAANDGPRADLQARLLDPGAPLDRGVCPPFATHYLTAPDHDAITRAVAGSGINAPGSRVKLIFVPSYLDGSDGIFNMHYYELLAGMDVTVFASYYEPWGYTPLESAAFGVPTLTTTLAGFGLWVDRHTRQHTGVDVLPRNDYDHDGVVEGIVRVLQRYATMAASEHTACRESAQQVASTALWEHLFKYYLEAYDKALHASARRNRHKVYDGSYGEPVNFVRQQLVGSRPTWRRLLVEVALPERLKPLEELSKNLWWTWTLDGQELFEMIAPGLWEECRRNPIVFLDRLNARHVEQLASDQAFLEKMDSVYAKFQEYISGRQRQSGPRIAYFSMEYGLANFLKIYSGGLGILAGDYLKEASDKNIPMTGIGLLYRYGYFTQKISSGGVQEASYEAQEFNKLPLSPVRDENGRWQSVRISFPGRVVTARIWLCQVGRTELYLLDTDHDLNCVEDRSITHYLYGGDHENRLRQEILLGIGGIRALECLGISADVYHCNEGHAAFMGIERINSLVRCSKLSFGEALEVVRSSSLFTTHTPVPAGHDAFAEPLLRQYLSHYPERLGISWEHFMNLGRTASAGDAEEKFSMSVLAGNLSQEINGVSRLHGEVSKRLLGGIWPGYFHDELHIGYVTNGVHFPTWTASGMRRLYMKYLPSAVSSPDYDRQAWQQVHTIPDEEFWNERIRLKTKLISRLRRYYQTPEQSLTTSPQNMVRILESFDTDMLTVGFARRFATYKRANLLLSDPARLSAIVNNPLRPVRLVFAGKAHPNDAPGQELIKRIVEISRSPEFAGRILFLANYDMDTARRMVQGVDVWLNTPTRPQEASGTSGMKAAMNGVMQFSVLDGWWVEGYREGAGWALPMNRTYEDQRLQDELDAALIYRTLEEEIAPLYYDRDAADGIPHRWIAAMKRCVADIASNFTTNRMLNDYETQYYQPLWERSLQMQRDDYEMARRLAQWKRRVSAAWEDVKIVDIKQFDVGSGAIMVNTAYRIEATVDTGTLTPEDIGVELIIAEQIEPGGSVRILDRMELEMVRTSGTLVHYAVNSIPTYSGSFDVALRIYPRNLLLPHRMDFALVKWA